LLFVSALAIFAVMVAYEVRSREARMLEIIDKAKELTAGSQIEDNSLIQQLLNKASSTAATTTPLAIETSTPAATVTKSKERLLAEKMSSPHMGSETSTLVIVEFADFECTICLEEFSAIRSITAKYAKDILFIYRQYPIKTENSSFLAQASLCAQEQGKFWQFHDQLFLNQGKFNSLDDVKAVAIKSGLDWTKTQDCVSSEKYRQTMLNDMQDAMDLGVRGTPTFFVNGNKLEGAVPVATWEDIIKKSKELIK